MARGGDEELLPEIVADQFALPHGHIGETTTVEFVIDAVDIIGAVTRVISG